MQGHASETFQNEEGVVHAGKEGNDQHEEKNRNRDPDAKFKREGQKQDT